MYSIELLRRFDDMLKETYAKTDHEKAIEVAGYLDVRIDQLPIAGSAPEYIAEKAIPIGFWTVSLGIFTHIEDQPNVAASERVVKWLTDDVEQIFGGKFYIEQSCRCNPSVSISNLRVITISLKLNSRLKY